ncbi:MAG: hypothetical protein CM15mP130_2130 [Verrucomicrobiota bacterium]|nr:MAG: hypothetical protein CM15mP130_2130 [Verrucomicrobiota bacterium]
MSLIPKFVVDLFDLRTCCMQGFKLLALALVISFSLDAKKPPNFVLVYMDDLGWAEPLLK